MTVEQGQSSVAAAPTHLALASVLRRLGANLLVACVVPAAVFYTLFVSFGIWPAILSTLAWSYGAISVRAVTRRRASGLLFLTAGVLSVRTVVALLSHSTFVYFLQPVLVDALIGTTFLVSAFTARPMVARLAGDFYPMDVELSLRPGIRRLFWHLTAMWAVVCLAKAVVMFWLLNSLSLDTFVLVKSISMPACNLLTVGITICAAVLVARREGLLGALVVPVPVHT